MPSLAPRRDRGQPLGPGQRAHLAGCVRSFKVVPARGQILGGRPDTVGRLDTWERWAYPHGSGTSGMIGPPASIENLPRKRSGYVSLSPPFPCLALNLRRGVGLSATERFLHGSLGMCRRAEAGATPPPNRVVQGLKTMLRTQQTAGASVLPPDFRLSLLEHLESEQGDRI
jgi:hypothetical protein